MDPLNAREPVTGAVAAYGALLQPAYGVPRPPVSCPPPGGGPGGSSAARAGGRAGQETLAIHQSIQVGPI